MLYAYYEAPNCWAPRDGEPPAVFLAGGISHCPRWHDEAIQLISAADEPYIVLNPNRADFPMGDPTEGRRQVYWEQHHLHLLEVTTLMWFPQCDPKLTVQPIALYELGQAWEGRRRVAVGADPAYPREQDVRWQAECVDPTIQVFSTLEETVHAALLLACGIGTVYSTQ